MAQMDSSVATYGDIVALFPNHCFIPTTSALDLDVSDLVHDIDGDPACCRHARFHAVYFPVENQEHVLLTAQNAQWFLDEVRGLPSDAQPAPGIAGRLALYPNVPNPFNPSTRLDFEVPQAGGVELAVYDVRGRWLVTLQRGVLAAGRHQATWDGRTASGARAPSGVYAGTAHRTRRQRGAPAGAPPVVPGAGGRSAVRVLEVHEVEEQDGRPGAPPFASPCTGRNVRPKVSASVSASLPMPVHFLTMRPTTLSPWRISKVHGCSSGP